MSLQSLVHSANHALSSGNFKHARSLLNEGLRAHGRHPDLLSVLAIASYHERQLEQATELFKEVAETTRTVEAISNYAMVLVDTQQFELALQVLDSIGPIATTNPTILFSLARAHAGLNQQESALVAISKAIALAPADADFLLFRAQLFVESDYWDLALQDARSLRAAALAPHQRLQLAGLLMQTGQFVHAVSQYRLILQQMPRYFEASLGMAAALERANDLPAMNAALENAASLVQSPAQEAALAHLQGKLAARQHDYANACQYLEKAWRMPSSQLLWRSQVGFDLAQNLDKHKQFASAWQTLNAAHALRNQKHAGSSGDQQQLDFFRMVSAPVPENWPDAQQQDNHVDPIFVIGFPRSGTTLLEQILDARESLVSFDEQPFLAKTLLRLQSMGLQYPEQLIALSDLQIKELRAYYFQQAEAKVQNVNGRRLVDKNPLNWARLPLIRALFPKAKVILALRHPCDVILSCYMQNLRSTVLDGAFSNFERIAELYMALVTFWQRLLPTLGMPVLLSRYEDLVSNPRASTQQIAEFLGMDWNEDWLDNTSHARSKAIIHTPSYAQVMEPMNQRAVGRWLNYRPFIDQQLLERLKPSAEAMGYQLD